MIQFSHSASTKRLEYILWMQPRSFLWRNIFQACTSRIAIYVDGEIEDRNVGEKDHSKLQFRVQMLLSRVPGISIFPKVRIRVAPTRFRVPDVAVYLAEPAEQVFTNSSVSDHRDPLAGRPLVPPDTETRRLFCDGLSEHLDTRSSAVQGVSL